MTQYFDNSFDDEYHAALEDILTNGNVREDRTGVGTISKFGLHMRFDIREKFPVITTKKVAWKSAKGELLWMVEGSGDDNRLKELSPKRSDGKTIWTDNAHAPYWAAKAQYPGDLGRVYGVQWRKWRGYDVKMYEDFIIHPEQNSTTYFGSKVTVTEYDQLANIIHTLKTNPTDRRMVLSAFNVAELSQMALPPCHMFAQFYVSENRNTGKNELSCQMYMRSADMFLGVPFNIASYSMLTSMIAHVTDMVPGDFILTIGDAHIYTNHIEQVRTQLERTSFSAPSLWLNPDIQRIDDFGVDDIQVMNYVSHEAISAPMAV